MTRKTKRDWLIAGSSLLGEVGHLGLTIEALCQRMGLTKGSFYHHFSEYEDFKNNLLQFYETEGTLDIIAQLAPLPTPEAKLRGLTDIIVAASERFGTNPEVAIRVWAQQDEAVKTVQERVDGRRLAYVEALYQEITGDTRSARIMAHLMYAILVGAEQMQPPLTGEDLRALFDEFLAQSNIE